MRALLIMTESDRRRTVLLGDSTRIQNFRDGQRLARTHRFVAQFLNLVEKRGVECPTRVRMRHDGWIDFVKDLNDGVEGNSFGIAIRFSRQEAMEWANYICLLA